ncbi:MAG: cation:proton antiporter [Thermoplasmatota archaeon]
MAATAGAILYDLAVVLVAAKLGGEAAARLRMPPVLGELVAGVLLAAGLLGGPLQIADLTGAASGSVRSEVLLAFGAIGAILLLFEVGLATRLGEMRRVGGSSLLVALIGIGLSFALGYAASWGLAKAWSPWQTADAALPIHLLHIFVGAALTATSVGITARVLSDLGRLASPEARIVLGAAVLDDIGGLLILAVVATLAEAALGGGGLDSLGMLKTLGLAFAFLALAILVGRAVVPRACDAMADRFRTPFVPLIVAIAFALAMSYAAGRAGLADIVGAFVAGLVLAGARHAPGIAEQLRPIAALFVGLFFVTLGMRVDVAAVAADAAPVFAIGALLTVVAIVGKLACGWGVLRRQADRLVVGVGMVPRGEVGLIFAGLGLSTGLVAGWQYAAVIVMVFLTTLVTPLWLVGLKGRFTADGPAAAHDQALADVAGH